MRELLAQCEANEMDLQQQQQLPSMTSLVPSVSITGPPPGTSLAARQTKVGSLSLCFSNFTVHQPDSLCDPLSCYISHLQLSSNCHGSTVEYCVVGLTAIDPSNCHQ